MAVDAHAAETLTGVTIEVIVPGEGGIFLRLAPQPAACIGSYKTSHGFISSSTAGFDELYTLATTLRTLNAPATIKYDDRGDCQSANTTLYITDIIDAE